MSNLEKKREKLIDAKLKMYKREEKREKLEMKEARREAREQSAHDAGFSSHGERVMYYLVEAGKMMLIIAKWMLIVAKWIFCFIWGGPYLIVKSINNNKKWLIIGIESTIVSLAYMAFAVISSSMTEANAAGTPIDETLFTGIQIGLYITMAILFINIGAFVYYYLKVRNVD